jgi:hypothetical protein
MLRWYEKGETEERRRERARVREDHDKQTEDKREDYERIALRAAAELQRLQAVQEAKQLPLKSAIILLLDSTNFQSYVLLLFYYYY